MKSMTGYGEARGRAGDCDVDVVIKSVNHKYFDFNAHLPDGLKPYEREFEKVIQKAVDRGRVDLDIQVDLPSKTAEQMINLEQAASYKQTLENVQEKLDVEGPITVNTIVDGPGVIPDERPVDREWLREKLSEITEIVEQAVQELNEARQSEGRSLKHDLKRDIDNFENGFETIASLAPEVVETYREKLHEAFDESRDLLTEEDRERINKRIRTFIEKVDLTEELDRLSSHIDQFREALDETGKIGRKLDFIAQEMLRETNTIAAKCNHEEISAEVVNLKTHLEGIREQTRNIE